MARLPRKNDVTLPDTLRHSAGYLLNTVAAELRERTTQALEGLGLQPRHVSVLEWIRTHGAASQHEIGSELGIDRTTMVALLDALESEELLRRERDPEDRRAHRVVLTSRGEQLTLQALGLCEEVQREFLAPLGEAEWERLRRALLKLLEHAR